jgi:transcriptional regulator with XRE-family HTH domain
MYAIDDIKKVISDIIKDLRARKGAGGKPLPLRDTEKILKIGHATIDKLERCVSKPLVETLYKIAKALNYTFIISPQGFDHWDSFEMVPIRPEKFKSDTIDWLNNEDCELYLLYAQIAYRNGINSPEAMAMKTALEREEKLKKSD